MYPSIHISKNHQNIIVNDLPIDDENRDDIIIV